MPRFRPIYRCFGFLALALTLCTTPWQAAIAGDQPPQAGARFQKLAQAYFNAKVALDPWFASQTIGGQQFESELAITIGPAYIAREKAMIERFLRETRAFPAADLDPGSQLNHALLIEELELQIDGYRHPGHLMPIDQYGSMPVALAGLGRGDQFQVLKTPANFRNYRKRLLRLPAWNKQAIANMREGMARGITIPKPLLERGLPSLRALARNDFEKSEFATAVQAIPSSFSEAERKQIAVEFRDAFTKHLQPSMQQLVAFLENEYMPKCRTTAGLGALPDGMAYYDYMVRFYTTTRMAPEEIHQLGRKEVDRIRNEIRKVQETYRHAGSVTEFLRWQSSQPEIRPFANGDAVLEAYRQINESISKHLPVLFGRMPKRTLEIKPVPELLRDTASDGYMPAPNGTDRPGTFYVVITDPAQYRTTIMTTLFLHEGQPGHHYQAAIQQELPLPDFRKYSWSTAFGEGWALYAETLGHEMGLYKDPNAYLGHLKLELLRATRLVVDTGLHAKGWTREQAIEYLRETEGQEEEAAVRAVERYMATPGQALAYKIGSLKIQELRARAQNALGDRFALKDFHDLILSSGTLPLTVLERQVDAWIAKHRR